MLRELFGKFDQCGFVKAVDVEYHTEEDGKTPKRNEFEEKLIKNDPTSIVIIPSKVFPNVTAFLNDKDIKPQFFKDYEFKLQKPYSGKDSAKEKTWPICYKDAIRIVPSTFFALITFWAAIVFSQ